MNAHEHSLNAMNRSEVDVANTVLDGELVDDTLPQPEPRRWMWRWWQRFVDWWHYSPRVPRSFKSRAQATQATKDTIAAILRSPWRLLVAIVRGVLAAARAWRAWVSVRDYREAAEHADKLADKFTDIRALTLFRWKVTGAILVAVAAAALVAYLLDGIRPLWIACGGGLITLAVVGRRSDGKPGRTPALSGPRTLTWTMDPQLLVDAFRDSKLIGKDEGLRLVERATRVGDGWAITLDLPATRKAADAIKHREALASALAVDEIQLLVERVRGTGGHAGRVALWVADQDPYATPPRRTPLLQVERWDAWKPVPFGRDARDRHIDLPLVWTSLLVGAIPRQGKTFAARLAAAGLILDPHVRIYVADFKAGKDWDAAAQVAHRFLSGDEPEHIHTLISWLTELVTEVQGRFRGMRDLDDTLCPESKITPEISRTPHLNMPITALFLDEVQVPLEERIPTTVEGKKIPAGQYVGELLTWLAKKGPAAGIVLILATQRPDSQTIPSGLRAVLGSRFALRVMDWRDSNIVLGEQMNTRGYDSSKLLPRHKGVGILRPDGDTDVGADVLALTVRTYYMPNHDWQTLCQRGRTLREAEGTLTGHAAGHGAPTELDDTSPTISLDDAPPPTADLDNEPAAEPGQLPEPLNAVADYLDDDLDDERREFVPSAELIEALDAEPTAFGRQMADVGCPSERGRIPDEDGAIRQIRGYHTASIHAAIQAHHDGRGPP